MKRITLILAAAIILGACSSASLPQQIPNTMREACNLYTTSKPDVIAARTYAAAHWDQIPADIKPVLLKLDGYLPKLDEAGQLLCAASTSLEAFDGKKKVQWDDVLSTVLKATAFAIELKQKGAI